MRQKDYQLLTKQCLALIEHESDLIANFSNLTAMINEALPDINWVGFYLRKKDELVLGPFQGKPACVRIPIGKGVCGSAFAQGRVIKVDDVHCFEGHISCDSASRSEIVLPFSVTGELEGVLDIDSPLLNRFSNEDVEGLRFLIDAVEKRLAETAIDV